MHSKFDWLASYLTTDTEQPPIHASIAVKHPGYLGKQCRQVGQLGENCLAIEALEGRE